MKSGPTPVFVLARVCALTAPAWLPVSGWGKQASGPASSRSCSCRLCQASRASVFATAGIKTATAGSAHHHLVPVGKLCNGRPEADMWEI
ncbi:MAG: hypothetical protein ACLP8S_03485 [Solirubrobacteraceae bacterium]